MSVAVEDVSRRVALRVDGLSVAFQGIPVIRDLHFCVPAGTTLAIIGPNGAGKSVLLRALAGAIPSRGAIAWAPNTRLGYVPQKLALDPDLPITALDLLAAKAEVAHAAPGEVADVLRQVGMFGSIARHPIGTLSGGEFQRVLLAFSLMGNPSVLLFDEPTTGLDEPGTHAVYTLIERLQRSRHMTVVLVSHELSVVYARADQVLCLSHAHSYLGTPADVLTPEHLRQVYGSEVRFHEHGDAALR
jgi:zinc transport system ATP-binding protein